MKITDIRTVSLTRRFSRTQRNSCDARTQRRFTFVLVDTDAGITGLGEASGNQNLIAPIIAAHYKDRALGLDPTDSEALWQKLYTGGAFWEIGGSVVCALSAIEVACWDIRGKAAGVPVSELLGGAKRDWIDAYASDLHWDEPAYMADMARRFVDQGFRWVKTHIGAEKDGDLLRLEAIRRAIGPDVGLMIDINTIYDRQTALEQGLRQAAFNPFWFEEPIAPADYAGHAWLKERLPLPIAAGENLYTVYGFAPLFACGGCDYAMPDILRCGGIGQTRLICAAAAAAGVTPTPHNFAGGVGLAAALHLMAAVPETRFLEYDPTGTAIYEELFVEPLVVNGGRVRVPTAPGLGVALTDEIIARYR
ncbi:MAG: mandelate racemase/muconate lactonizing enzyme family protein [Syntrophales bacterium]